MPFTDGNAFLWIGDVLFADGNATFVDRDVFFTDGNAAARTFGRAHRHRPYHFSCGSFHKVAGEVLADGLNREKIAGDVLADGLK